MSTRTGNRVLYGDGQTYPAGLTNIPMASYMRITRFQYNDGLKRARENGQQGAGASLGELGDKAGKAGKLLKDGVQNTFGGVDRGDYVMVTLGESRAAYFSGLEERMKKRNADDDWKKQRQARSTTPPPPVV
mgnify:CR=1 FL=1